MDEERGVSLGEIFKIIFKRIWWALGVTAAFILIAALAVQFWYNPNHKTYSVSFDLDYPDGDSGLYPDGTTFRIAEFVTLSTLTAIKESNEEFASIDLEKMIADDAIGIAADSTGEYFTLTVSAKYFSSNAQAVDFIRTVVEYPVTKINRLVGNAAYSANLNAFNLAKTYDEQIAYLQAQMDYIDSLYADLIELYGQYYTVNGVSLGEYNLMLKNIFNEVDINLLNNELATNCYVKDEETFKNNYEYNIAVLTEEKTNNEASIAALKAERDEVERDFDAFNEAIVDLVVRNSEIDIEIANLQKTYDLMGDENNIAAKVAFEEKLGQYVDKLTEATETFKQVRIAVYGEKTVVIFKSNRIEATGGVNVVVAAIAGAIVGFIVAGVVICIIDMPKFVRKRNAALIKDEAEEKETKEDE